MGVESQIVEPETSGGPLEFIAVPGQRLEVILAHHAWIDVETTLALETLERHRFIEIEPEFLPVEHLHQHEIVTPVSEAGQRGANKRTK